MIAAAAAATKTAETKKNIMVANVMAMRTATTVTTSISINNR